MSIWCGSVVVFFNDTATTEIYTLSLHDALPISRVDIGPVAATVGVLFWSWLWGAIGLLLAVPLTAFVKLVAARRDRKSTRLNSSHTAISYAAFCLQKKYNGT